MAALEIIWRGYDGIIVRKGPGGEREVVVDGGEEMSSHGTGDWSWVKTRVGVQEHRTSVGGYLPGSRCKRGVVVED